MYSILLLKNATTQTYSYYENRDGAVYGAETLEDLGKKIKELLNNYTLTQIVPVKNCEFIDGVSVTVRETGTVDP